MITPQRIEGISNGSAGGASSGRRVVRSVLETLATNVTPQPRRESSEAQKRPFTEVSTRTNRSRFIDEDGASALEFLSPPKPNLAAPPRPQQKKDSRSDSLSAASRPIPRADELVGAAHSQAPALDSQQVDILIKSTLDAYIAQRDEEEERILSQATGEIDTLQRVAASLEEENRILLQQVDSSANEAKRAREELGAYKDKSGTELEAYKKAISLLKKQCSELTNATTDQHVTLSDALKESAELQSQILRVVEESDRSEALHKSEMDSMRRSAEEGDACHASEVRILNGQIEDLRRQLSDQSEALRRARADAENITQGSQGLSVELEALRRQLSTQKSHTISAGHQLSASESTKKEAVKELNDRVRQLDEICKSQTDDLRKKAFKITTLEGQKDELQMQLDAASLDLKRFGDKMSIVTQTVAQIATAAEQLESALKVGSDSATKRLMPPRQSASQSKRSGSVGACNIGRSKSVGRDDGNATPAQRVLAAASDAVQQLQPVQHLLRDAVSEVAMALDGRAAVEGRVADLDRKAQIASTALEASQKTIESLKMSLNEAHEHSRLAESAKLSIAAESQKRLATSEEYRQTLASVAAEKEAAAAELQTIRRERLHEKALVVAATDSSCLLRVELEKALHSCQLKDRDLEGKVAECLLLAAKVLSMEADLAALTIAHDKISKVHKKMSEDKALLEEGAQVAEREVNILHNKVRTLESSNASLRKKVSKLEDPQRAEAEPAPTKKIATSSIATQLQAEIDGLKKQLAAARAEAAATSKAGEEAMAKVLTAVNSTCASEAEFLDSIVGALRRFMHEAVEPFAASVAKCLDTPSSQQYFSILPHDTTIALSPSANYVSPARDYGSPSTALFGSPSSPAASPSASSPLRSLASHRTVIRNSIQSILHHAAEGLHAANPVAIEARLSSQAGTIRFLESELTVLRSQIVPPNINVMAFSQPPIAAATSRIAASPAPTDPRPTHSGKWAAANLQIKGHHRSISASHSAPGLSATPMDGTGTSPRRPPALRAGMSSAPARRSHSSGVGPGLALPMSANM